MKVNNSLMVQPGEQVHLLQGRCLPLGSCGHKLCSILQFPQLLSHTFNVRKCTSAAKTQRETLGDQLELDTEIIRMAKYIETKIYFKYGPEHDSPSNFFVNIIMVSQPAHFS